MEKRGVRKKMQKRAIRKTLAPSERKREKAEGCGKVVVWSGMEAGGGLVAKTKIERHVGETNGKSFEN